MSLSFLVTEQSPTKGIMGIAGNIVNTLYIVVLTLLAATPIGVGGAIYLNEYAKPGKFVSLVQFTIETLTGIPSIIFGLFGNVFFGRIFGYSMLTGALTLTIMVLPLIARNTQEALRTVPDSYRSGALGIGVVHDPDHPSSQRHARDPDGSDLSHRPYRGRVGGPSVHRRQRLLPSQGRHGAVQKAV